jgi:hypothetical protein
MYITPMNIVKNNKIVSEKKIKKPNILYVILKRKNGNISSWWSPEKENDKYYSSVLDDKRHIYSFLELKSARNCLSFLQKYKQVNNTYPELHSLLLKKEEDDEIYTQQETIYSLTTRCLLNNIGLMGISSFEYTFYEKYLSQKNVFNISMSAIDLLENESISQIEHIDNLNYLLDI